VELVRVDQRLDVPGHRGLEAARHQRTGNVR
jgi:hypothetical protein